MNDFRSPAVTNSNKGQWESNLYTFHAPQRGTNRTQEKGEIKCSEHHRTFFKEHIGRSFVFNVSFQKWLKSHAGQTYREAIAAYYQILEEKKCEKTKIDKQFEYNTYIRDFFADNKGKTLEEAIKYWKYKKQLKGHNRYEKSDLVAISCKF